MLCYNCSKNTNTPVYYKERNYLCPECHNLTRLPRLALTKQWEDNALFNPRTQKYLNKTIVSLAECGFSLYRKTVFLNKTNSPQYREILIFRYSGELICNLIQGYTWVSGKQRCKALSCGQHMTGR